MVKTPARLHFGILDLNGNLGRIYGSLGLAIDFPNTFVEAQPSEELIQNSENVAERFHRSDICPRGSASRPHFGASILWLSDEVAQTYVGEALPLRHIQRKIELKIYNYEKEKIISIIKKLSKFYGIKPKLRITVKEAIPEHVGLGSGTQLALAIGVSISKIYGLNLTSREISNFLRKGNISGIGTYAFESGGFIIDSGFSIRNKEIPVKIFRYDFPKDWKFIVAIPGIERGLKDSEEGEIFKKVIPAPQEISARICRLTLMKLIPSLLEKDIKRFGSALTEINRNTGLCFRKVQGGIYRGGISRQLINFMLKNSYGAGQSSWGPAVFALVGEDDANELNSNIRKFLNKKKINADVFVAGADNRGAEIKIRN